MRSIYKKEIGSFYRSMMGYLYTAFFLLIAGVYFAAFNLQGGISEFGYVLGNTMIVLLVVIPVLTMRTLGGEQRQRTDQLLYTSPVNISQIVLGKFLAVLTVFTVPLLILATCPLVLSQFGKISLLQSYSSFLAFFFMGASCIAIGIFISSLTENQIIAAVLTFAVMLLSYLINGIGSLIKGYAVGDIISPFLQWLSLFQRYYDFVDGYFDVTHLVYYVSVVVLFLFLTVQSIKKRFRKRSLYMRCTCALMAVIVVLLNAIAVKIPAKYMKFDTSAFRIYSLSDQTKKVVESLDETVELYLIAPQGKEDEKLTRLLEKYEELGDKIKVTYVDSILSPTFVQSYTSDKVSDNSIIAVGPERSKVIRNSDLFPSNYDYNTGKTTTDFDGEGQITSAIHFVTGENLSHMYMITGHGETELPEQFTALLEKEGVEYDKLNLMTINEVPQNAECMLEYIPVSDITKTEAEVLTKYLENGGKLLLITGISAAEMPNLGEVMSGYGMASIQGLIMEGDGNHCIPSYQNFLLPEIKDSAVTSSFISKDELLLLPNSHAITVLPDVRSTVDVQEILTTSKSSWLKTDTSDLSYKKGDLTGPFAVGVLASEPVGDDQTRIAWFSSDSLMVDEIDEMVSGNNKNLILNTIGWMTEQDNNIAIRAKNTQAVTLRLTSAQVMQWSIVYLAVIPGIVLAAGIIFCVRRRRRQ